MQIMAAMPSLDLCMDTIVALETASILLTDGVGCTWRWLFLDCTVLRFIWHLVGPLTREKSSKPGRLVIDTLLSTPFSILSFCLFKARILKWFADPDVGRD